MKFAPNSPLLKALDLDGFPEGVEGSIVPEGMFLCSACGKEAKLRDATLSKGELLKTERIIGPYDDFTVPGHQTFEKKQVHFSRKVRVCPDCSLKADGIKFPPMRG